MRIKRTVSAVLACVLTVLLLWLTVPVAANGLQAGSWEQLQQLVADASGHTSITLTANIHAAATLYIPAGANITLTGDYSLIAGGNYPVVTVAGAFTLDGPSLTRTGTAGNASTGVRVMPSGNFTMRSGVIHGNQNPAGGGVSMLANGTTGGVFTMYGGVIRNNTAVGIGGGGVNSAGTFIMRGGSIRDNVDNSQFGFGGGVHAGNGTFTMSGGEIRANRSATNGGGGVHVHFDATFYMTGGYILDNSSANVGGGVHCNGVFLMSGGIISGNTAARDGGGLFTSARPAGYRVPLQPNDYPNISIHPSAIFYGNTARFAVPPHESAAAVERTASTNTSIFGHLLNNYDINFAPAANNILVTFYPGTNGTLPGGASQVIIAVPSGTTLTAAHIPTIRASAGYTHSGWSPAPPVGMVITQPQSFTAQYTQNEQYTNPPGNGNEHTSPPTTTAPEYTTASDWSRLLVSTGEGVLYTGAMMAALVMAVLTVIVVPLLRLIGAHVLPPAWEFLRDLVYPCADLPDLPALRYLLRESLSALTVNLEQPLQSNYERFAAAMQTQTGHAIIFAIWAAVLLGTALLLRQRRRERKKR